MFIDEVEGVNRRITDEVENGSKILGLKAPLLCHDLVSVNGQITVVKYTIVQGAGWQFNLDPSFSHHKH